MNKHIKIWNQSANIMGNYVEMWNARNSLNQDMVQSIYPTYLCYQIMQTHMHT